MYNAMLVLMYVHISTETCLERNTFPIKMFTISLFALVVSFKTRFTSWFYNLCCFMKSHKLA